MTFRCAALSLVGLAAGGGVVADWGASDPAPPPQVDHVLIGVADLDEGIGRFEEMSGVRAVIGGRHPGGTQNALAALGPGLYLELIALQKEAEGGDFAFLRELEGPTFIGWAVATPDLAAARGHLEAAGYELSASSPGSRTKPDGATLAWAVFGIAKPQIPGAPFFIQWSPESPHPSTQSPGGCTLESLRIVSPLADELHRMSEALGLEVEIEAGGAGGGAVVLACPTGRVEIGS